MSKTVVVQFRYRVNDIDYAPIVPVTVTGKLAEYPDDVIRRALEGKS